MHAVNWRTWLRCAAAAAGSATALAVQAQATYGPYQGQTGYLEIQVDPASYVVAFHGDRDTAIGTVRAGWAARAAQLCEAQQAEGFVQLRYSGEPVQPGETYAAADGEPRMWRTAGPIYVPIYIPMSGPRAAQLSAPSKVAAMRCIRGTPALKDPQRLVRNASALEAARSAGLTLK